MANIHSYRFTLCLIKLAIKPELLHCTLFNYNSVYKNKNKNTLFSKFKFIPKMCLLSQGRTCCTWFIQLEIFLKIQKWGIRTRPKYRCGFWPTYLFEVLKWNSTKGKSSESICVYSPIFNTGILKREILSFLEIQIKNKLKNCTYLNFKKNYNAPTSYFLKNLKKKIF